MSYIVYFMGGPRDLSKAVQLTEPQAWEDVPVQVVPLDGRRNNRVEHHRYHMHLIADNVYAALHAGVTE